MHYMGWIFLTGIVLHLTYLGYVWYSRRKQLWSLVITDLPDSKEIVHEIKRSFKRQCISRVLNKKASGSDGSLTVHFKELEYIGMPILKECADKNLTFNWDTIFTDDGPWFRLDSHLGAFPVPIQLYHVTFANGVTLCFKRFYGLAPNFTCLTLEQAEIEEGRSEVRITDEYLVVARDNDTAKCVAYTGYNAVSNQKAGLYISLDTRYCLLHDGVPIRPTQIHLLFPNKPTWRVIKETDYVE